MTRVRYAAGFALAATAIVFVLTTARAAPQSGEQLAQASAVIRAVAAERGAIYTTEAGAQAFTQAVSERLTCLDLRWGRKSTNAGPISNDTVAYSVAASPTIEGPNVPMRVIDYIYAAGDPAARLLPTPDVWQDLGIITDQRFYRVTCADAPPPPLGPGPGPVPPDLVAEQLERLTRQVAALTETVAAQRDTLAALREAVLAIPLPAAPPNCPALEWPDYYGKVFGFPVVLRPER